MHGSSWFSVDHSLDECIKCNICTSYCPVSAVTDLFPGPKYAGPQAQRFRENGQPMSPDHSADYCSGCRVCNEVCPTGVKIAELNARARAQIVADNGLAAAQPPAGPQRIAGQARQHHAPPGQLCAAESHEPRRGRKGDGHRTGSAAADMEHRRHAGPMAQANGQAAAQVGQEGRLLPRLRHHVL